MRGFYTCTQMQSTNSTTPPLLADSDEIYFFKVEGLKLIYKPKINVIAVRATLEVRL